MADAPAPSEIRPRAQAGPHRVGSWAGTALVAVVVTLLNWPAWAPVVPGVDPSWQAGLAVAFTRHMQWGPAVDFTFGPYGFAGFLQPFYRSTALLGMGYVFIVTWLLAALLVAGLRNYWWRGYLGLAAAGTVAWAVIAISWAVVRPADFASVAGLGLALSVLRVEPGTLRSVLATALGALAGFTLLVKLDTGLVLVGLLALALAGAAGRGWRLPPMTALVAVFALAWAADDQSFANLPTFAHASLALALGYSSAMGGRLPGHSLPWRAIGAGALTVVVFAAALQRRPRRDQRTGVLMLAGWGWVIVKDDFVSGNHFLEFFRIILVAVALTCLLARRPLVFTGALVLTALSTLAVAGLPGAGPVASLRSGATELAEIAQPSRFSRMTSALRGRLLRDELLSPAALSLLKGHTVAIEPWEDLIAWAVPGLRWDPEPVLQSYSVFTASLDRMDASFLASGRAPALVLYQPLSFDGRDPAIDPPATMVALYCNYAQVARSGPWQVLGRVQDRCGPAEGLYAVDARFGQEVRVPDLPGKIVTASFLPGSPLLARVEGALLKPPAIYLSLWPGRGPRLRYRLLPGTEGDGSVLSAPAALGYSAPFMPARARDLELSGGGWGTGTGSVTITFRAMSMSWPRPYRGGARHLASGPRRQAPRRLALRSRATWGQERGAAA